MEVHQRNAEPWKVTLVDTGENTQTGGRIKRIQEHIEGTFCLTYGDGVSDLNLQQLMSFHRQQKTLATLTAIQPAGRFGSIEIAGARVKSFLEKPQEIIAGSVGASLFVNRKSSIESVGIRQSGNESHLEGLARDQQLSVHKHEGFWAAMDTMRDRIYLEQLWEEGKAPWKTW